MRSFFIQLHFSFLVKGSHLALDLNFDWHLLRAFHLSILNMYATSAFWIRIDKNFKIAKWKMQWRGIKKMPIWEYLISCFAQTKELVAVFCNVLHFQRHSQWHGETKERNAERLEYCLILYRIIEYLNCQKWYTVLHNAKNPFK